MGDNFEYMILDWLADDKHSFNNLTRWLCDKGFIKSYREGESGIYFEDVDCFEFCAKNFEGALKIISLEYGLRNK